MKNDTENPFRAAGDRLAVELLARWPATVARKILRLIEARLFRMQLDRRAVADADRIASELIKTPDNPVGEFTPGAAEAVTLNAMATVRKTERAERKRARLGDRPSVVQEELEDGIL